jgi:RNA-binding protein YhbY
MKKIIFLFGIVILVSCGSVNRTMFGTTEKNLIKTVAIEQNCDKENIEIIEKIKGLHGATYALDVCGNRVVYKQVGSVFMEASKADKMVEDLTQG